MMDPILKEQLLGGLEDAVANYNSGMDEETAIAKAASDLNFNKNQTERLVELYNTSLTLHHFEKNASDKAAPFRLADKAGVLELLFDTSNEKMASEFDGEYDMASDYTRPETDFYGCKSAQDFDFDPVFAGTEHDIPDLNANSIRMRKQLSRLQKEAEHLENEAGMEFEYAHEKLSKLANKLSSYYAAGNSEKIASVVCLLAEPANVGVFDNLSKYLPSYILNCDVKRAHVVDDRTIPEEATLVRGIAEHCKAAEEMLAQASEKIEACKKASGEFDGIVDSHLKNGKHVNEMDQFVRGDCKFREPEKRAGDGLTSTLGRAVLAKTILDLPARLGELREHSPEVDKEVDDANKRFVNMHREMVLTDLINNDPYLSEEDPSTIAGYYSHFAELSPELANNKEVVRSVLRQAVHNGGGGYSPFDAGSFMDAEKTLREIRGTLPAKKTVKVDLSDDEDK